MPKILSKGPTNRENGTADYQNPLENIIAGIEPYVQSWLSKHGVITLSICDYKQAVVSAID